MRYTLKFEHCRKPGNQLSREIYGHMFAAQQAVQKLYPEGRESNTLSGAPGFGFYEIWLERIRLVEEKTQPGPGLNVKLHHHEGENGRLPYLTLHDHFNKGVVCKLKIVELPEEEASNV